VYGQVDLAGTPEDQLAFLTSQLDAIAVSAQQAKARGDTADLQSIIALYRKVSAEAAALRGLADQAEQPSAFMQSLSAFSDQAVAVGKELGVDTGNVLSGIATTGKYLPLIVGGALVVAGIGLFKGSISVRR
jgi:hypothetical protein